MKMEITIKIKAPPKGYTTPKRGPLWLPINKNLLVLIGECWTTGDQIISGGSHWIYAELKEERRKA